MNDPKFSFDPKLKLDYSSADQLYKALKTKKISNSNIQLIFNEIKQNSKSESFVIEVLVKILFERINSLEEKVSNLQKLNRHENKEDYIKRELEIESCSEDCIITCKRKLAIFQSKVFEELDVKWKNNNNIRVNKKDLKTFNDFWEEYSKHQCLVRIGPRGGRYYEDKYYFSFK